MQPDQPITTNIPHFDDVLGGGIPRGAIALIMGVPGSGKTTLASQIVFDAARAGKRALIMASFSESTATLISHLRTYTFFDENLLGGPIQVLSLRQLLSSDLTKTQTEIIKIARQHKVELIMLDSVHSIHDLSADAQSVRQFFYDLGTQLATLGITTIITSEAHPRDADFFAEMTTADLVIGLHFELRGVRQLRGLEVVKVRGAQPLPGLHAFTMSAAGGSIYPQLEERVAAELLGGDAQTQGALRVEDEAANTQMTRPGSITRHRSSFGLPALDRLLGGGVPQGTSTVLAGSIGVGKTLLSLHFALAGTAAGERVTYLSFRETREQLGRVTEAFAIGDQFHEAITRGRLSLITMPPIKVNPDIIADRLLNLLDETKSQRLVIDSIAEIEEALASSQAPGRLRDYLAALTSAFQARGLTTLLIKETIRAVAPTLDFSAEPLAMLAENVMLAQQITFQGQLHRILSVLKLRYSAHDTSLREFTIAAPEGIMVSDDSDTPMLHQIADEQETKQRKV